MGDLLDATDAIEQAILDQRIAAIRNQGRELYPIGRCHWCDEDFAPNVQLLFCDTDCSDDYHKYHRK